MKRFAMTMLLVVMAFSLTSSASKPDLQSGYAFAAAQYIEMADAIRAHIIENAAAYGIETPSFMLEDRVYPITAYMLGTKGFCENPTKLNETADYWMNGIIDDGDSQFLCEGVQFMHALNDYRLTGMWFGRIGTFDIHCQYDLDTGAIQMVVEENGEFREHAEFKPLGDDRYALQYRTREGFGGYNKAITTYKDGEILSLSFAHPLTSSAYRTIYPSGDRLDRSWFDEDSVKNYYIEAHFDGVNMTPY